MNPSCRVFQNRDDPKIYHLILPEFLNESKTSVKKLNIPDNYDLFAAHDAEMGAKLDSKPVCVCCEEPIQDDHMYDIYGDIYCEDCMISQFRRSID